MLSDRTLTTRLQSSDLRYRSNSVVKQSSHRGRLSTEDYYWETEEEVSAGISAGCTGRPETLTAAIVSHVGSLVVRSESSGSDQTDLKAHKYNQAATDERILHGQFSVTLSLNRM